VTVPAVPVQCPIEIPIRHSLVHALTCNGCETVPVVPDVPGFHSHTRTCACALRLICKLRALRALFAASVQVNAAIPAVPVLALSKCWNGELRPVTSRD
jgi:hypothetical protein